MRQEPRQHPYLVTIAIPHMFQRARAVHRNVKCCAMRADPRGPRRPSTELEQSAVAANDNLTEKGSRAMRGKTTGCRVRDRLYQSCPAVV
jgi:hypothetical protein